MCTRKRGVAPHKEDLVAYDLTTSRPCSPDGFTGQGENGLVAGRWQVGLANCGENR